MSQPSNSCGVSMEASDLRFDLPGLSLEQRLRRWRDAVGDHLVDVDMRAPTDAPVREAFTGSMMVHPFQDGSLTLVDAAFQRLDRTAERIRRASTETALLTLILSGECRISQRDRVARLGPGDLCLYESVSPYRLEVAARTRAIVVTADRASVEAALGDLRPFVAAPLSSASAPGGLATNYWKDLVLRLPALDPMSARRLVAAGLEIVSAGLAVTYGHAQPAGAALTLRRAKAFIAGNIHRESLSGKMVATAVGLSERRLQELFQQDGATLSGHIRRARLEAARQQLADPAFEHVSIGRIADNFGFPDAAHFSRAFRTRFGVSPTEARAGSPRRAERGVAPRAK
ncbi:helix-turn-helix domain-containing protein [Methylocystis iwaonis]|uniref:helix-turn-helix domain-containing protein n=1 Tax=Methylocystis iwaonis TaxID=2885079 RepID=UPI002E7ACAD7|nr:helix-turn-helix domain-containing protein [Methylocystis iwaonis]